MYSRILSKFGSGFFLEPSNKSNGPYIDFILLKLEAEKLVESTKTLELKKDEIINLFTSAVKNKKICDNFIV